MGRIDPTVKKETIYVAAWEFVLTAVMLAVFLVLKAFDWTVLTGALLGSAAAVGNFLLMGLTIQGAIGLEEKEARTRLRGSQNLRMAVLTLIAVLGAALPCFNMWSVLIPLFFPRIAVTVRSRSVKDQ